MRRYMPFRAKFFGEGLFEHDSDSAIECNKELKELKTSGLISAFYSFRQEMLAAIDYRINLDPMVLDTREHPAEVAKGLYQLLRECERRGLALDKF